MAAEDEQGESASNTSRDNNAQLTDSSTTTPARPPAAGVTNGNNNSTVTPSTTSSSSSSAVVSASTASATDTSSTAADTSSTGDGGGGGGNSSDSFLAAAAAEARQQQQGAPATSNAAAGAVGDSALLVDSTQKMSELTASSVAAVSSKLEQVRGYIRQTSTAMEGLEQQADLSKIGQYNTLVKVLRELKTSEAKLATHLATLLAAGVTGGASSPAAAPSATDALDPDGRTAVPNSQSIGLVSSRTVHNVDNTGAPSPAPSFSDRLAAGMEEANQITGRLRENVARREDLVERYRATRERLSALKRQRRDIQQQERSILLAHSSRDSPYEDPIPGASGWSLDELNSGLDDFRALYDKVATLRTAYTSKAQALEEGDAAGRAEIDSKMQQLENKRAQLIGVITQLKRLRADKLREQGMDADVDPDDFGASPAPSTPAAASSSSTDTDGAAAAGGSSAGAVAASAPSATTPSAPSATTPSAAGVAAPKPELQQQLSAAVEAMEETEGTDPVSRGGSVSIGTLPTLASAADITGSTGAPDGGVEGGVTEDPIAAVVVARAEMEAAGRELTLRTQHLNNLREELAGMKRLLDTTQRRVVEGEEADGDGEQAGPSSAAPPAAPGEMAGQFITGVNGNIIRLSDLERQDPAVIEKYKQLSAAKQRMAQMEQIMQAISSSRGSGLPLNEVLSPEQLSLLEEAEAEEDPSGAARLRRSRSARRSGERDSEDGSVDRDFFNDTQPPSAGVSEQHPSRLVPNQAPPSLSSLPATTTTNNTRNNSSSLISSSAAARRQNQLATEALSSAINNKRSNYYAAANNEDSDEVASDVRQRLAKPSNAGRRPVNEEAGRRKQERWGSEDSTNQQHFLRPNNSQRAEDAASSARSRSSSSCNERSAAAGSGDPRVAAIATLQEELRQKKNALEALMRGMGKPSSLHPDNISDNISDGESGTLTPTPTRPARGRRGNRDHSVDFSSVPDAYRGRGGARPGAAPLLGADGGTARPPQRLHAPSGAVMSFNNLSAGGEGDEAARSVRPKQNSRSSAGRLPESNSSRHNLLGDAGNTQQTITDALQQLSTVQGSINSLYDTLRTERDVRSTTPSVANNRQQMALQQQQELQQQQQVLNNMFALAAPAQASSLLNGGVPPDAAVPPPAPLVSGLQQCFSQLYLHSLEIQALNKHIQVRHQQQMLQLQHLHQQQQLQQVQQQQQQLLGAGSYYSAPALALMAASPYTSAGVTPGIGVLPNTGLIPGTGGFGSSFGVPTTTTTTAAGAMGVGIPGVAPTGVATPYSSFPNWLPF